MSTKESRLADYKAAYAAIAQKAKDGIISPEEGCKRVAEITFRYSADEVARRFGGSAAVESAGGGS